MKKREVVPVESFEPMPPRQDSTWAPGIWTGTLTPPPPLKSPTMRVVELDRERRTVTLESIPRKDYKR